MFVITLEGSSIYGFVYLLSASTGGTSTRRALQGNTNTTGYTSDRTPTPVKDVKELEKVLNIVSP